MDTSSSHIRFNLKVLLLLSFGHLVTDIYQGTLPAILPFLKDKLALSYTMAGAIMMASNITSSVIQPLFGHFSDKKEKAFLLPLGCLGAGVGLSLLSVPSDYAVVMLLVIVGGLGVASYHPEGYRTASFFTGDKPATGMSIFSVGGNLGFALAPLIALSLIDQLGFDYLPLMIVFALLFVAVVLPFWSVLNAPLRPHKALASSTEETADSAYLSLFFVIGAVIMRSWVQMGLMTYIPFYYIDHLKGDPLFAGKLVSIFLLGGAAGTLIGSPLADRWGHKRYLVATMALSAVTLPAILQVQGVLLYVALGVSGMILISSFSVTIVMAQRLLPRNLGVASGLMVGFAIGTGGLGVTLLGIIADRFGVPTALETILVLPVIGLVLSLLVRYPRPTTA